jgi:hypothetical protein
MLAVWFILKMIRPWIQAWQNKKDGEKISDALSGQAKPPVNQNPDPEEEWDRIRKS